MTSAPAPAALVPQSGRMCLLDEVAFWDDARVACMSASHRRPDHPLRRNGVLGAVHLLEYAAQASAVHAALTTSSGEASTRLLASVRDFELNVARIDDVEADLRIDAQCLLVLAMGATYGFRVSAERRLLCSGRLSVASPRGTAS